MNANHNPFFSQVNIVDLRERSWYYVCVEWENFNRHNETTGADCRLFRTLDRFGKTADTTLSDIEITDMSSSSSLSFRLRAIVDFPLRITASLQGGAAPIPAASQFYLRESADVDLIFTQLRANADYGKLCVVEEPLVTAYTAMGRLIAGMHIEKCYFGQLKTKDYDRSSMVEASAYRRSGATAMTAPFALLLVFTVIVAGQ